MEALKITEKIIRENAFEHTQKKETRVTFNRGLSANRPSNNWALIVNAGKNNRFPFFDILGYLKNTHKNLKFGRVRQVPTRELDWEFPRWDLSHFAKFGIFVGILQIS